MLRPNVKEYAESGNVRSLHYIFRDALDADPTFEDWQESYEYCEKVPGFFEPHKELTPFTQDESRWKEEAYWVQLKMDLMENFSKERYEHLRKVAEVFYAEKIRRIRQEEARRSPVMQEPAAVPGQNTVSPQATTARKQAPQNDLNAAEEERIRQRRKEIEENNRQIAEAQRRQDRKIEQERQRIETENNETRYGGSGSKKFLGVVLAAVVILLAIVFLLRGSPNTAAAAITARKTSKKMLAGLSEML